MTNKIEISRELSDELAGLFTKGFLDDSMVTAIVDVVRKHEAPAVERQEPVAIVMEETHNYTNYLVMSGKDSRVERPRPVVEKKAVLLDREIPVGTKLYTSPPAPVAVALPERPSCADDKYAAMTPYEQGHGRGACEMWGKVKELNQ